MDFLITVQHLLKDNESILVLDILKEKVQELGLIHI